MEFHITKFAFYLILMLAPKHVESHSFEQIKINAIESSLVKFFFVFGIQTNKVTHQSPNAKELCILMMHFINVFSIFALAHLQPVWALK